MQMWIKKGWRSGGDPSKLDVKGRCAVFRYMTDAENVCMSELRPDSSVGLQSPVSGVRTASRQGAIKDDDPPDQPQKVHSSRDDI